MSRSNYGYVGRRSGGAAWQWIIIGMVMGFGCSVVLVLGGLAAGFLNLEPNGLVAVPTQTPFVITATPAPVTATIAPSEAPPTETQAIQIQVAAPSATPTIDATFLTLQPTIAPTGGSFALGQSTETVGGTTSNTSNSGDRFARLISLESTLVTIPGGTFEMGTTSTEIGQAVTECKQGYGGEAGNCQASDAEDALPQHNVTVSSFSIEQTEVTYAQFLTFMNALGPGSHRNGCGGYACMQTRNDSETSNIQFDGANYSVQVVINDYPVANVTWYGAQAYCQAIGRRLPTEAEWEHAARGSSNTIYPWGNNWDGTLASTKRPATGQPSTVPVSSFPGGASLFGPLNMAGNVAEWVSDWYDAGFYGRPEATISDPTGPVTGTQKVIRGGSWDAVPFFARSVSRQSEDPLQPTAYIGFRCAQDANAQSPTSNSPIGANTNTTSVPDLPLPTSSTLGGNEENTANNSAPTLPPQPTTAGVQGTLQPGG